MITEYIITVNKIIMLDKKDSLLKTISQFYKKAFNNLSTIKKLKKFLAINCNFMYIKSFDKMWYMHIEYYPTNAKLIKY